MTNPTPSPNGIRPLLVVFAVAALVALILLILPPTLQQVIFGGLVIIGIITGLWRWVRWIQDHGVPSVPKSVQSIPSLYAWVSLFIAVVLICLAAYYYQPQFSDTLLGFEFLIISLPFVRLAFPVLPMFAPHVQESTATEGDIIRYPWLLVSVLSMVLLMLINMPKDNMHALQLQLGFHLSPTWAQMLILGVSLFGMIQGFAIRLVPRTFKLRWYHGALTLIVLLGGFVRAWDLEFTLRLFVDEFFFMKDVIDIRDFTSPLLLQITAPTTDIYSFFQTLAVQLLGPSLTSLRIISPIISMGAILAIYALARQLFSIRVTLIACLLFATLPVHIQFGRIGMNMIVDPVIGMFAFMFVFRGMRSRRISDFAMAGICFGLTHYFYEAGRLFFTAFFLAWLVYSALFSRRDPLFRLPSLKQMSALLFCLTILAIPIYVTQQQFDISATRRLDATREPDFMMSDKISDFLLGKDFRELGAPIHRYVLTVARDNFYQSDYAYVLPVLAPFFLFGFWVLMWRINRVQGSLLVWWALGIAIANSLIADLLSAASPRHIVVYAILMMITAVGVHTLWTSLAKGRLRWLVHAAFGIYLIFVSVVQIDHYFNRIVPNFYDDVYLTVIHTNRSRPAFDDMILRAIDLPPNTSLQVFTDALFPTTHRRLVPAFYQIDPETFTVHAMNMRNLSEEYFIELPRDVNYVFTFTRHHQEEVLSMLSEHFVITKIEGSPFDVGEEAEMLFAYAPLSANPPP